MLKRISKAFAAALVVAFASIAASPIPALAAAPLHQDQVPGYYRLKVGALEVTTLFDGAVSVPPSWLFGEKTVMDPVEIGLKEDPHLLDAGDSGFLVNTGAQLILVDVGSGEWYGGGTLGHLGDSLRRAGYKPEQIDRVFVTHAHADHIGGLTTKDGKRIFPNADVYLAKAESDFWLSKEIAAKSPKEVQPFFEAARGIAAPYIKAGKWHTFSGTESIMDGVRIVPLAGHTPGHTGYEFTSEGHKILFWGDTMHSQVVQMKHPEVTVVFDIDHAAAAATRNQLLQTLVHDDTVIAGPHLIFPGMGRLRKDGDGYLWVPVVYTDKWTNK